MDNTDTHMVRQPNDLFHGYSHIIVDDGPKYSSQYLNGDECTRCGTLLYRMKHVYKSMECIHCGVWCGDCLELGYSQIDGKLRGLMNIPDDGYEICENIYTEHDVDIRTHWVNGAREQGEDYPDTCPLCKRNIINITCDITYSLLQVTGIVDIIHSYIDWDEQSSAIYEWDRQELQVTCIICCRIGMKQRRWVYMNGYNIICSQCVNHVKLNNTSVRDAADNKKSAGWK